MNAVVFRERTARELLQPRESRKNEERKSAVSEVWIEHVRNDDPKDIHGETNLLFMLSLSTNAHASNK